MGKCRPQRALQNMLQADMWAVYEGAPLVLRDLASRFPRQGPPWGIEGEPKERQFFEQKRPFKANNKGDTTGYTGHHEKEPTLHLNQGCQSKHSYRKP